MPNVLALIFGILFCVQFCAGQTAIQTNVDEYIRHEMQAQQIPGLSLAVMESGRIVMVRGYGLANVELQVPVKPETIFQSGSMGKQFTATAVAMLVADGKLRFDDKITKYFGSAPSSWTNVTIRHLLTHTAGFANYYPKEFDLRRDYTEDELLERIEKLPLEFSPGDKWSYSNLGYMTLGILIHRVSGQFYGDFLQERIFKPLNMDTARIISEADIIPNRAAGYLLVDGKLKNQEWVSPTMNSTADGSLYLSVLDMAKWDAALYTDKPLKQSALKEMWTRVKLNDGTTHDYGFGWEVWDIRGHPLVAHGGSWQGFRSYIVRYPRDKLTVVVLANLRPSDPATIAQNVAGLYNPELKPLAPNGKQPKN
jgi:CubicO group peptidase (beta-lactamase class C family)